MPGEVEITIAGHPRWLRLARSVVRDFCAALNIADRETPSLVVAVDEALSNVMKHAYGGDCSQFVSLSCSFQDNELAFEIRDRGAPFNPFDCDSPPPNELRSGGRGLYLIRAIMGRVEYRREDGFNCIRLSKTIEAPERPAREKASQSHGH